MATDDRLLSRRRFMGLASLTGSSALLAACGLGGGGGGSEGSGSGTLNALFMKQAGYSEDDVRAMTDAFTAANPGVKVDLTFVAYEALHDKIVAAAAAGTYDVVLIDVIWPAEFGTKNVVKDVTSKYPDSWGRDILGGALDTAQYQDRYYGVPWILDTKYLFYNESLLGKAGVDASQLDTWDGVLQAARAVKSRAGVEYPLVWSWAQAEALICDYAQLLGAFDGQFLDSSGRPAFNTGGGLAALEWMKKTLDDGLTNPASTESLEEDVRKTFSTGQAAMALNWTYMYALANDPNESEVVDQVGILQTPAGPTGSRPGVNGSMAVAVAAGSENQAAAWKYVTFITSREQQQAHATSSLPIWKASYGDPKVVKVAPETVAVAKNQLNDMILRPQVPSYNAVSQQLQSEIQNALLGRKSPRQALDDAAEAAADSLNS